MEYKVGSLANLISGVKSPSSSMESKLFRNVEDKGKKVSIKYQAVHKPKKVKAKRKFTEEGVSVRHDKRQKIVNETDASSVKPDTVTSTPAGAVKRLKNKRKREVLLENEDVIKEHNTRTIFVGNVPHDITAKKLRKLFEKYGTVESVRLRCPPLADPRVPKKVAVIKRDFHTERNSMHAFIRFVDVESAHKALVFNGTVFQDHHIRVDMALRKVDHDQKKAVFLGNVPFAAEEDDLWKMFETCGKISGIRLIRDRRTGIGKGFAYINFESADAVELALKLDGEELKKRKLRVQRCVKKPTKKPGSNQKHKTVKKRNQKFKESSVKTQNKEEMDIMEGREDKEDVFNLSNSDTEPKRKHLKPSQKFSAFQGQKVAEDKKLGKKKNLKKNKIVLRRRALVMKLVPKSKTILKTGKKLKTKSLAKKIKFKPSSK
jgi:nucleolar protein 12